MKGKQSKGREKENYSYIKISLICMLFLLLMTNEST